MLLLFSCLVKQGQHGVTTPFRQFSCRDSHLTSAALQSLTRQVKLPDSTGQSFGLRGRHRGRLVLCRTPFQEANITQDGSTECNSIEASCILSMRNATQTRTNLANIPYWLASLPCLACLPVLHGQRKYRGSHCISTRRRTNCERTSRFT